MKYWVHTGYPEWTLNTLVRPSSYETYKISKAIETGSKLVVAFKNRSQGGCKIMAKRGGIYIGGNK
jgi:hypothetical protein